MATTTVAAQAAADTGALDLGTAASFAVLAGSAITFAGAVNTSQIAGDIGTFPTPAITGLENLILNGTNHGGDAIIQAAQVDLAAAYIDAAGRAFDVQYTGGFDLLGLSLGAGVYNSASSLFLSGNLTLDAHGNSDAVWIFQAGSTLITASNSSVTLLGGAQAGNVFWQVGSSATLGTGTSFAGSILALTSITVTTGATVNGRVLARNGAVTIDSTVVEVPVPVAQRITGSGTISGDLTVVGTLAPGSSPGVLTVDGTTTFTSGSIFEWQLDTTSGGGRGVAYDGLNTRAVAGNEAVFSSDLSARRISPTRSGMKPSRGATSTKRWTAVPTCRAIGPEPSAVFNIHITARRWLHPRRAVSRLPAPMTTPSSGPPITRSPKRPP